jgi:hypothetical protein
MRLGGVLLSPSGFDKWRRRPDVDGWTARPLRPVRRPPLKHAPFGDKTAPMDDRFVIRLMFEWGGGCLWCEVAGRTADQSVLRSWREPRIT